jgi:hypothetical protein
MLESFHQNCIPLSPLCLAEEVSWRNMTKNVNELVVFFGNVELLAEPPDLF